MSLFFVADILGENAQGGTKPKRPTRLIARIMFICTSTASFGKAKPIPPASSFFIFAPDNKFAFSLYPFSAQLILN